MEAHSYLAYSPRGAGLASALFYLAIGENVYGWYTGASSYAFPAAYFALEPFYSTGATLFYLGLPVQGANPRANQFHRFDQRQPKWIYAAPGIDLNVIAYLKSSGSLDDKDA